MATETFFNLNEEKKNRVYEALLLEYTSVCLEDISVKNISTLAGIPRGSFYQYFKDKEDALAYLIRRTQQYSQENLNIALNNVDVFDLIEIIFMREINKLKNKEQSDRLSLLKQIIKSTKATSIFYHVLLEEMLNSSILDKCFENTLKIDDKIMIKNIFDLIFSTLKDSLSLAIEDENKIEMCISNFKVKIQIIKLGVRGVV